MSGVAAGGRLRDRGGRWVWALAVALVLGACGEGEGQRSAGSDLISRVIAVTEGGDFQEPLDATPAPDGGVIYFTASSSKGPGVFRVHGQGGEATPIFAGAPFAGPVGVAVSLDGGQLFVADPEAATGSGAGAVFTVPVAGGEPTPVAGTEGLKPRGIEVVRQNGGDRLYFTGATREGKPAVFSMPVDGGSPPAAVAEGSPLTSPDAVTATRLGVVYVTDRGPGRGDGAVYRVSGGTVDEIAGIRPPVFAGVTLTDNQSVLLVSSSSAEGTDQVQVIDLDTRQTGVFDRVIGANRNGGGLHRAHDADVFAWAGVRDPGRVYRLDP